MRNLQGFVIANLRRPACREADGEKLMSARSEYASGDANWALAAWRVNARRGAWRREIMLERREKLALQRVANSHFSLSV